jgi:hypothetical protein
VVITTIRLVLEKAFAANAALRKATPQGVSFSLSDRIGLTSAFKQPDAEPSDWFVRAICKCCFPGEWRSLD